MYVRGVRRGVSVLAPSKRGPRSAVKGKPGTRNKPSETRVYFTALSLRTRTPGARALLPATRYRSSGPLGALLSSPALDVRLMTALQVLQVRTHTRSRFGMQCYHLVLLINAHYVVSRDVRRAGTAQDRSLPTRCSSLSGADQVHDGGRVQRGGLRLFQCMHSRIDRFSDYTHRRKLDEPRRDRCESHTGESHSSQYTNTDGVYGGAYTISVLSRLHATA